MTDEEYLFKQTSEERKRIAQGAFNKKRQGGKYVRLPSDNLTRKEREALNGEVKQYKEKPFYKWEEFKKMPDDLKLKWLNSTTSRYGITLATVAQECFGISKTGLYDYLKRNDLYVYANKSKGNHGKSYEAGIKKLIADKDAFYNALSGVASSICDRKMQGQKKRSHQRKSRWLFQKIITRRNKRKSYLTISRISLTSSEPCEARAQKLRLR